MHTGAVRTPKESLHWNLSLGVKFISAPATQTCVSMAGAWLFSRTLYQLSCSRPMSAGSMKIIERENMKQLNATQLNVLNQGQTWQRPCTETRTARQQVVKRYRNRRLKKTGLRNTHSAGDSRLGHS